MRKWFKKFVLRCVVGLPTSVLPYGLNVLWLLVAYEVLHTATIFNFISVVFIGDVVGYVTYQAIATPMLAYLRRFGYYTEEDLRRKH